MDFTKLFQKCNTFSAVGRKKRAFREARTAGQAQRTFNAAFRLCYHPDMSKTEILEELPKLTKTDRDEIRLKIAELDGESWLESEEPLTAEEKALLESRLATYLKDPEAGSSWEEVETRIRSRLTR